MAADSVIGLLRVLLSANTAEFDTAMKDSTGAVQKFTREADKFSGSALFKQADAYAKSVAKIGDVSKLTAGEQVKLNSVLTAAVQKYAALGKAAPEGYAQLIAQTANASKATGTLTSNVSGLTSTISALAPALGAAAIVAFAKNAIDGAGAIQDLSEKLGVSTTTVQRWKYTAEQTGATIDDVAAGMGHLSKAVTEGSPAAVAAFDRLGLSIDDVRKMAPDEMMNTVAEAIGKIPNPTERAAAAMELFGKGGTALLPAMVEGFTELGDQAERTGNVMSESTIKAADDLGDSITSLTGSAKTLMVSVLAPMLPLITSLASALGWLAGKVAEVAQAIASATATGWQETLNDWQTGLELVGLKAEAAAPKVDGLVAAGNAGMAAMAPPIEAVGIQMKDLDKTITELDATAKKNSDTWAREAAEAMKKAEAAADALNASQQKLLDTMHSAGIMTEGVVADALAPLIEKLNLAAQVGDQQLRATLILLSPEFLKLRAQIIAAGGDVSVLDGILGAFNQRAGNTITVLQDFEKSIPVRPFTDAFGPIHAFNAELEIAGINAQNTTDAFHEFGLKTPEELSKVARAAERNYQIVSTTAGVTRDQVKKAWHEMTEAQMAESGRVPSQWETEIMPRIRGVVDSISSTVADSFAQMVTHASGFKDAFLNIWHGIQSEIENILGSILKMFIDRFIKGMLAAMTGAQGGFTGAFQGMMSGAGGGGGGGYGGIVKQVAGKLIGGGATAGGAAVFGGAGATATGAVVGTGELAGVPIMSGTIGTSVAPGAATAGMGGGGMAGVGATMAGAGIIGGAGFGLGALGQKFFGRGAGAATFGGASGAATGALIGTMVFPGIGTAVGALIGGLAGVVGGIVNFGASKKEKAARGGVKEFQDETFKTLNAAQQKEAAGAVASGGWTDPTAAGTLIAVRDAYIATGKSAADAERDVRAMWEAEKQGPEATAKAMEPMLAALDEYQKKQKETADATATDLDAQKAKYTELREHIIAEMVDTQAQIAASTSAAEQDALVQHQADLALQLKDATAAIDVAMQAAAAAGDQAATDIGDSLTTIPDSMIPVRDQLIERLKEAGIDATGPDALGKINEWLLHLGPAADVGVGQIETAFGRAEIPELRIPYAYTPTGQPPSGAPPPPPVPAYAGGTPSLGFVDFGAGRLVELHGQEAVIPRGSAGAFAAAHAGSGGVAVSIPITIQAWDGTDVARVVNSPAFTTAIARRLPLVITDNLESARSATRRALGVD